MNALTRTAAAILLATLPGLAAMAATPAAVPAASALPGDSVYQLALPLTDQQGRRSDWRARRGRPQLVSMFYTSCRYSCPLIVESGKAIERQLEPAQRERLDVLLISLDPARDTPAALQTVAAQRRVDPQRWTLAAPAARDVRAVAGTLGIRYRQLADGDLNHSSEWLLLDADGRVLARTARIGTTPDPDFLAAVRRATSTAP